MTDKLKIANPDLEVILGGGSLIEGVNLFRRLTGFDLRMSKELVEKLRAGRLSWRDYFDAADPCGACEGTGFAKPYVVGQQVGPGLVVVHEDTLRMLKERADVKTAQEGSLETISKLRLERRGFQIMARQMMQGNDPGFWRAALADGKYERAGGDAECGVCRLSFVEHPELPGFPTFHMICNGDIVKT